MKLWSELTHSEFTEMLDTKYIATPSTGRTFPPGFYGTFDLTFMLKSLHPDDVKINITNDDIKLRSNSSTYETTKNIEKPFFKTILGFT